MRRLPDGTVTLLFSDVDGSTRLLTRLGPEYAAAMDGQRRVLRSASTSHGGTEMGTEGDGFFIAFPTAPSAVAAAVDAQRALAAYPWPQGEHVRVRMGIHTGNPVVHDGGYIGMDVHRAARIAGAAHGGQVVLSDTTAHLVIGGLPADVGLRDLGTHRLKDLPAPERLFDLRLPGLPAEFAPLRSLGAASSLPAPATPLIGRDTHLAELSAAATSGTVRLATLTGPGGAGKTRLAIAVAQRLIGSFPDGVYFVPLAAVTNPESMWATIAEVLDVPPESRTPPAVFDHLAHRSALFVLDNLEQVVGADTVVAEILDQARQAVVIATSRSPLHVVGEREYAVQPLDLPVGDTLSEVERSAAVQLFVQQAASVRSGFELSGSNAAAVAAICRRLDGLPLAIELAAARAKMLSPHAILGRLDTALDMSSTSRQGPSRQRTLRDTIDWSYHALTPSLQRLFRALAVFAGGADLEAIGALTDGDTASGDPLDLVAGLVDASLVTVTESADGEPRVRLLDTMRAYAGDQLTSAGERRPVHDRHARHFLALAEGLGPLLHTERHREARARFGVEIDNFRAALAWASGSQRQPVGDAGPGLLGLRLCTALEGFWSASGFFAEERGWVERAVERARGSDCPELAECLNQLAQLALLDLDLDRAREQAQASVDMCRRLGDATGRLSRALETLASVAAERGRYALARPLFAESLAVARDAGDLAQTCSTLLVFAIFVGESEHDYQAALEMETQALRIALELGDHASMLRSQVNMACSLRLLGRTAEARQQMRHLIARTLEFNRQGQFSYRAEDYAAVLADAGEHVEAVRLLGAAEAHRELLGTPRTATQQAEIADAIASTRAALSGASWGAAYRLGHDTPIEEALARHASDG